jgi:GNAT superfamily N-acetyltransferase
VSFRVRLRSRRGISYNQIVILLNCYIAMNLKKEEKRDTYAVRIAVEDNGQELGRAYLYLIFDDAHDKPYGSFDVLVEENQRGKGLGTKLVEAVIAEAKERGCYKLIGTSRYSRPQVHAWYESLGFKDYGKEFRMDLIQ